MIEFLRPARWKRWCVAASNTVLYQDARARHEGAARTEVDLTGLVRVLVTAVAHVGSRTSARIAPEGRKRREPDASFPAPLLHTVICGHLVSGVERPCCQGPPSTHIPFLLRPHCVTTNPRGGNLKHLNAPWSCLAGLRLPLLSLSLDVRSHSSAASSCEAVWELDTGHLHHTVRTACCTTRERAPAIGRTVVVLCGCL